MPLFLHRLRCRFHAWLFAPLPGAKPAQPRGIVVPNARARRQVAQVMVDWNGDAHFPVPGWQCVMREDNLWVWRPPAESLSTDMSARR